MFAGNIQISSFRTPVAALVVDDTAASTMFPGHYIFPGGGKLGGDIRAGQEEISRAGKYDVGMPDTPRRRRGRPARVDRARIIAAARTMDPQTVTMQAVAEELGVDRKTLNYHVSDREGLLELVALDVLAERLPPPAAAPPADWQQALRDFAIGMHDALTQMGTLFEYVRMPLDAGLRPLESTEELLTVLVEAGFDPDDATRAASMLAQVVYVSARDAVLTTRNGGDHPQYQAMRAVLADAEPDRMPHVRRLVDQRQSGQLAFNLDVLIDGLSRRLPGEPSSG